MTQRIVLFLLLLCLAVHAEAAMVRVIAVEDGRTLTVDHEGHPESLQLSGIEITDEVQARALLQWTVAGSWVMVEERGGGVFVYRSPDALFINRELVQRGFARATRTDIDPQPTTMVTYLGIVHPKTSQLGESATSTRRKRAKAPAATAASANSPAPANATGRAKTSSDTRRRPSRSPSPPSPTASAKPPAPEDRQRR